MDFISHFLIALIFGTLFRLDNINMIFFLIGSLLSDLSAFAIMFYYKGGKGYKKNFLKDKKKKPEKLFAFYDFSHSLLLILILLAFSYFYFSLIFLSLGLLLHIIIDIPLHKKHSIGFLFPFKKRIQGYKDWFEIYDSFGSRILIWSVLLIIFIIVNFLIS
jgi:hypothetical protein